MNIVVCVKQVPDTTAKKEFGPDFRIVRTGIDNVINPFDEYAIEEALRLKEAHGGQVTILTMGPPSAEDMMRKALAMGGGFPGVLVTDQSLEGSCAWTTGLVLAKALGQVEFDLVLLGMESTDARTGLVPGALAEQLSLPLLSYATSVTVGEGTVSIRRQIPGGYQEIEAATPAVVSVVKGVNEPRYPSLKGIMAAKRKEIKKVGVSELGLSAESVGLAGSKNQVVAVTPRQEREQGETIKPDSAEDAARQIADWLQSRKFI